MTRGSIESGISLLESVFRGAMERGQRLRVFKATTCVQCVCEYGYVCIRARCRVYEGGRADSLARVQIVMNRRLGSCSAGIC